MSANATLIYNELKFRNNSNAVNVSLSSDITNITNINGSDTDHYNVGKLSLLGNSTPCYLTNGRLLPQQINISNNSVTLNLTNYNNFHIYANTNLSNVSLVNVITGQSGHIIIQNVSTNSHSVTWYINSNTSYIKWPKGTPPTLSSTNGKVDIISYYVISPSCILMNASLGYQ